MIERLVRQGVKLNAPPNVTRLRPLRNKEVGRRNSDFHTLSGEFSFTVAGAVRTRNDETNHVIEA